MDARRFRDQEDFIVMEEKKKSIIPLKRKYKFRYLVSETCIGKIVFK